MTGVQTCALPIYDYLKVIFFFNLLGETLILSDVLFELIFPIPSKIRLRIFSQMVLGLFLIVGISMLMATFSPEKEVIPRSIILTGFALGLTFVMLVSSSLLIFRFTDKWISAQHEISMMKQEKLRMDYNSLQDQLNPHFLFNNLSVLKSLIIYDKDSAIEFTENFTDVYRYVLQSKDNMFVPLAEEIKFINSYIGLHKERLGDGLEVNINIEKDMMQKDIAPLTLQLLIENAIKHNTTGKDKPLVINLYTQNNLLVVANTLQKRKSSYSTKTGLKNLIMRYKMLAENKIDVDEKSDEFLVRVPLV